MLRKVFSVIRACLVPLAWMSLGWMIAILEGLLGDKILRLGARRLAYATTELHPSDLDLAPAATVLEVPRD